MLRVREHVDGLHGHDLVGGVKQLQVASLRGGVAADVDDLLRPDLQQLLNDLLGHSGTGRVGDDEVGATVRLDEVVGEHFGHIARIEGAIGDAVDFSIDFGILDGGFHIFDAHHFLHEA